MLTREQALDEIEDLGTVAHALCVEYLLVGCVLGNGAQVPLGSPAVVKQVASAVTDVRTMALTEMHQLSRIDTMLVAVGREPTLGRATTLAQDGADAIALAQFGSGQLDGMLDRELAIARAADARFSALLPTLATGTSPVFDDAVSFQLEPILANGSGHADAFAGVRTDLAGLAPTDYLRVTGGTPADDVARGLLDLSDRYYAFVVSALLVALGHPELGSAITQQAESAMFALDEVNGLLAGRGLLPAFTAP